jgi:inorganic pyrophosphatase
MSTATEERSGAARGGERVRVRIEVPRFGFVKREEGLGIEYISPIPCPFNYGCLPDVPAPDGDPQDAIVLGPRLPAGTLVDVGVFGVVHFRDAGAVDDKLICGHAPSPREVRALVAFFRCYAIARRWLNRARGLPGVTRYEGVLVRPGPDATGTG